MMCPIEPMDRLVALCAEGARKFGDDPKAITDFIEAEICRLPDPEQRKLRQTLALMSHNEPFTKPA